MANEIIDNKEIRKTTIEQNNYNKALKVTRQEIDKLKKSFDNLSKSESKNSEIDLLSKYKSIDSNTIEGILNSRVRFSGTDSSSLFGYSDLFKNSEKKEYSTSGLFSVFNTVSSSALLNSDGDESVKAGRKNVNDILYEKLSPLEKINFDEEKALNALDEQKNNDPLGSEEGLAFHQYYEDAKTAITAKATEARKALLAEERSKDIAEISSGIKSMSDATTGMMDMLEKSGNKQSNSYKALFAMSKAFAVAQASLNLYVAVTKAMSEGNTMPERFANIAAAMASGVQFLSVIQGITMSGQAHAGIDYIPREGTWLLDRGERVVDSRTNADLKQYLSKSNGGSGGGSSVSVNVPLSIQSESSGGSGVTAEDASILAGMIKSKVYEIVSNEQRPGGLLSRG